MPLLRSKVEALLRGEYLCSACAPDPAPNGYPKALAAGGLSLGKPGILGLATRFAEPLKVGHTCYELISW